MDGAITVDSALIAIGAFAAIVLLLAGARIASKDRFTIESKEIVAAVVAVGLGLFVFGEVSEIAFGDIRLVRAIKEAAATPVGARVGEGKTEQISAATLEFDEVVPETKGAPDRIPRLIETKASALREVRQAVRRAGVKATVALGRYEQPTHTGLVYPTESYFPTWCEPADAPQVASAAACYRALFKRKPVVDRWIFSTNGVSIAGMFGIPCVGFGPAPERVAHTVQDSVPIAHLVQSAAFYAAFPGMHCKLQPPPPVRSTRARSARKAGSREN